MSHNVVHMRPYIKTYSGVDFLLPNYHNDPDCPNINRMNQVRLIDIAHSLGNLCRFTGHTRVFYSVAQHCYHVAENCDDPWEGLMHDAREAYANDLATPVKSVLSDYRPLEQNIHEAIAHKFGLARNTPENVKEVDRRMCLTEALTLVDPKADQWPCFEGVEPIQMSITPWTPAQAKVNFLQAAAVLQAGDKLNEAGDLFNR